MSDDEQWLRAIQPLRVERLDASRDSYIALPYLKSTLARITQLSEQTAHQSPRRYVLDLLRDGYFIAISPFDEKEIVISQSIVLNDKSVFFWNPTVDFVIIASDLGAGFPFTGIYIAKLRVLLLLNASQWTANAATIAKFEQIRDKPFSGKVGDDGRIIITGDGNFAHHIWNQLGALDEAFLAVPHPLVRSLVTTNSPLGNMADLVPPLRNMTLFNIASYETEYLSTLFYLTVPVGASFVTKQFVTRVVNYAVARLSPQLENFRSHQLASSGKKFWISIRTRNRTAVNQVEFLVALVNHLLKSFDGCTVLLDGHSTPMDIQHNKSYDQADVVKTIENDTNVVGAVMSGLHKVNMPTDRVISAVGLPILDSIALAGIADFYICHHGTLQHKIGWFYSKPGIVHAPNSILAQGEAVASWVTAQSETAIAPVYLPADHVQDTEVPNEFSSYPKHLKLDNYFIVNIPDAIEMILKCAKYHLS